MSELRNTLDALTDATGRGERCALATVVCVEGSAYRRGGARMLITEAGATVGALSGGCLERDVAERARAVIEAGEPKVVRYDTASRDDIVWGLGLGCDGVVHILIEPAGAAGCAPAEAFLRDCSAERRRGVMATVFAVEGEIGASLGGRLMLRPGGCLSGHDVGPRLLEEAPRLFDDLRRAMADGATRNRRYEAPGGAAEVLVEVVEPPLPLTIFGAEHDAAPLARLARNVGWHVTVVDTKARPSSRERFAHADEVLLCRPGDVSTHLTLSERTTAVVMTHNYLHDRELLRQLVASPAPYIGMLGPKRRAERMLLELLGGGEPFQFTDEDTGRLHAPVGLDTGAETPEEIAVSIIAEVRAVAAGRAGGFLRERLAPIHDAAAHPRSRTEPVKAHAVARTVGGASCLPPQPAPPEVVAAEPLAG